MLVGLAAQAHQVCDSLLGVGSLSEAMGKKMRTISGPDSQEVLEKGHELALELIAQNHRNHIIVSEDWDDENDDWIEPSLCFWVGFLRRA